MIAPKHTTEALFKQGFATSVRDDQAVGVVYTLESLRAKARGFFGHLHTLTAGEERALLNHPWPTKAQRDRVEAYREAYGC